MIRCASPFGWVMRSKYSVNVVFALYGTPFFRRYPGLRLVVTTFNEPVSGAWPRRPGITSHCADDVPCHVPAAAGVGIGGGIGVGIGADANENTRVCVPASVSIFSVRSSCQVMCRRPGTRMMFAAP